PIVRTCGSTWSWASSCTIARPSTGCSSTTAWADSATTGSTPDSRRGGATDMAANTAEITLRWREALEFEAAAPGRPPVVVDANSAVAASPVELLLAAAASCTASDVVLILQKQRVVLRGLEVLAQGTRRAEQPRRYTALHFVFTVTGEGADEAKARRAFWGPELGVARRPGAQGRFALTLAAGDYEGALGVRVAADAQLLLRPGERVGPGPYGGLGLAFVGAAGARGAGYLTALVGVE